MEDGGRCCYVSYPNSSYNIVSGRDIEKLREIRIQENPNPRNYFLRSRPRRAGRTLPNGTNQIDAYKIIKDNKHLRK